MSATCPQLGFDVRLTPRGNLEPRVLFALRRAFAACIEGRSLAYTGTSNAAEWAYVVWRDGSQADDLDREALRAWVAEQPAIEHASIGLLFDVERSE
ncbi:MAG: 50S ribosome-binding protein YggL [bacterium]